MRFILRSISRPVRMPDVDRVPKLQRGGYLVNGYADADPPMPDVARDAEDEREDPIVFSVFAYEAEIEEAGRDGADALLSMKRELVRDLARAHADSFGYKFVDETLEVM